MNKKIFKKYELHWIIWGILFIVTMFFIVLNVTFWEISIYGYDYLSVGWIGCGILGVLFGCGPILFKIDCNLNK